MPARVALERFTRRHPRRRHHGKRSLHRGSFSKPSLPRDACWLNTATSPKRARCKEPSRANETKTDFRRDGSDTDNDSVSDRVAQSRWVRLLRAPDNDGNPEAARTPESVQCRRDFDWRGHLNNTIPRLQTNGQWCVDFFDDLRRAPTRINSNPTARCGQRENYLDGTDTNRDARGNTAKSLLQHRPAR